MRATTQPTIMNLSFYTQNQRVNQLQKHIYGTQQ